MAKSIQVKVVAPDRICFDGEADSLIVPVEEGYIGILPNHMPVLSTVGYGTVTVKSDGDVQTFEVLGGFLEVKAESAIVLANAIATPISEENAKAALDEALKTPASGDEAIEAKSYKVKEARALLKISSK